MAGSCRERPKEREREREREKAKERRAEKGNNKRTRCKWIGPVHSGAAQFERPKHKRRLRFFPTGAKPSGIQAAETAEAPVWPKAAPSSSKCASRIPNIGTPASAPAENGSCQWLSTRGVPAARAMPPRAFARGSAWLELSSCSWQGCATGHGKQTQNPPGRAPQVHVACQHVGAPKGSPGTTPCCERRRRSTSNDSNVNPQAPPRGLASARHQYQEDASQR